MAILIKATGFILSLLPYEVLEIMTECLARIFMLIPSPRRRVLLSNLRHAFPDWSYNKVKATALESAARMFEMGFFSLCYPFMTKDQLRRTVLYSNETEKKLAQLRKSGKPVLFLIPHVCLFEALATSPFFRPQGRRRLGAIYRPNKNKALDNWVNNARLRTGIDTFPRSDGFFKSKRYLKERNWLAVLFDQDSGRKGKILNFLDRATSYSNLPELLTKSTDCTPIMAVPLRNAFFSSCLNLEEIQGGESSRLAHVSLQELIRSNPNGLPEWLWGHAKWKSPIHPKRVFASRFNNKFIFEKDNFRPKQKLWIRMPNWLGDIVMTLPVIFAIHSSRPDIQITLLCNNNYKNLLQLLHKDFKICTIPCSVFQSFLLAFMKRREFPDLMLVFTNSLRGDIESYLTGVPFRYGVAFGAKKRFKINQLSISDSKQDYAFDPRLNTQVSNWAKMIYENGFTGELCTKPLSINNKKPNCIGIIAGSSNNEKKCWKPSLWVLLITRILQAKSDLEIFLFGTPKDSKITNFIEQEVGNPRLSNRAGKTNLVSFANELAECRHVIGNDTGGVHLANLLGIETLILYGPTNPIKTKPVFDAKFEILQPNECPPEGGHSVNDITVDQVWTSVACVINIPNV
jgi:ADP-heptose:LPS heptosyltransferase/lauroyl/myristoyl acyltransferase